MATIDEVEQALAAIIFMIFSRWGGYTWHESMFRRLVDGQRVVLLFARSCRPSDDDSQSRLFLRITSTTNTRT